jgi:hypothetical protein
VLTIDDLPDDDLLAIFDFYVIEYQDLVFREYDAKKKIESWQSLVHVCRRWRGLVFASPRRLNLQLCCTPRISARSLDVWPALPLLIKGGVNEKSVDNVIAELEHSDRIRQIDLVCHTSSQNFWTAMQVPFPELAVLNLRGMSYGPVLPDSILGGSAPRLRFLALTFIPFPGLPKLLLFTTHLVQLNLSGIPRSGYISPEAMATCLSMLTSLETLHLGFDSQCPRSSPDQESRRSPPPTRFVLPSLTDFWFEGVNEYLEDLVSRIDAPQLCRLLTNFLHDTGFNTPELIQFISRTPTLGAFDEARLIVGDFEVLV